MRNRKLANRFLFSLQQRGILPAAIRAGGCNRGRRGRAGYGGQNVVTEAGAFEHLAWLSLCAVLFLFLLANQLADWLNEKLHCECVCVSVSEEKGKMVFNERGTSCGQGKSLLVKCCNNNKTHFKY